MMKYLFALLFLLSLSSPAWATKYWVSTTAADDSASCAAVSGNSDPGTYKKTLLGGWNCLSSGDTVHMKAGTWTGTDGRLSSPTLHNGTANAHTIIEGEGVSATFLTGGSNSIGFSGQDNSYVEFRDFTINMNNASASALLPGTTTCSHIWIIRLHLTNANDDGILGACSFTTVQYTEIDNVGRAATNQYHGAYLQGPDTVFEYNYVHDVRGTGYGLQCYFSGSTDASRCTVRYNRFVNTPSALVMDGPDSVVNNNIMTGGTNSGGAAIVCGAPEAGTGCVRAKIFNNTIYNNVGKGIWIGLFGAGTNSNASNNLVTANSSTQIQVEAGVTGVTQSNNACLTGEACGSTGKLTITAITSCTVSTSDFTEKSTSTCINAGIINAGFPYNDTAPDIGAFEKQTLAVCTVENGDASTLRATYNNAAFPPLLPATGITGFTSRKAGSNNPIVGGICHVTGTNRVDCPLTNAIIGSDAVDVSYTTGSGTPLTDSALIGGTLNQPYPVTFSNQSCTNNVGAGSTAVFTQTVFKWFGLRGTEAAPVATPYPGASENTANIYAIPGGKVRLRIGLSCTTADCPPTSFILEYSRNAGAYMVVPSTFGADGIAYCGNSPDPDIPNQGTVLTQQLSGSGTFAAGAFIRTSNAIPTIDMALNGRTEIENCLALQSTVAPGDTWQFREYKQDGTVLDAYTVTPKLTAIVGQAGFGF